jgi:kinesin family member 13
VGQAEIFKIFGRDMVTDVILGYNCSGMCFIFANFLSFFCEIAPSPHSPISIFFTTTNNNNNYNYNDSSVFAYGQTSSGKSYTMTGSDDEKGLIPRICECLFFGIDEMKADNKTFRIQASYYEIYNEKVCEICCFSCCQPPPPPFPSTPHTIRFSLSHLHHIYKHMCDDDTYVFT